MAIRRILCFDAGSSYSGADQYILKPGGVVTGSSVEILPGATESLQFSSIGALALNSSCYLFNGGVLYFGATMEIVSVPVFDSGTATWSADVHNSATKKYTVVSGSRLVLRESSVENLATVYDDVFYAGDPTPQPRPCPYDGRIRIYVDELEEVDVILDSAGAPMSCFPSRRTDCPVVHPEDFGAVGDGLTDDRAALQAAIDYLANLGGGTIELMATTYSVGRSTVTFPGAWGQSWYFCLQLRSGITICGRRGVSTLRIADDAGEAILLIGGDIDHCHIKDVRCDGNTLNAQDIDIRQGVYLLSSQYCVVSSCEFFGFGRKSLSTGIALMIGVLEDTGLQDSTCNLLDGNVIHDNEGQLNFGIRLWSDHKQPKPSDEYTRLCCNNIVTRNFINGTIWATLQLSGPAIRSNTVSENVLKNIRSLRGVLADKGASGNLFVNNTVDGLVQTQEVTTAAFCEQGDIPVGGDVYPERFSEDNTWIGNTAVNITQTLTNVGVYGFYCNRSRRVTIIGMRVSSFSFPAGSTTVAGLMAESEFSDATIDSCSVRDAPVGITLVGSGIMQNVSIGRCNICATYRAVWVHHDSSFPKHRICIANCQISTQSSGDRSVFVADGSTFVMTGNVIDGRPLLVDAAFSGEFIFQGNAVSVGDAGVLYGIEVQQGSFVCVGSVISTSAGFGIYLGSGTANGLVSSNHLLNNPCGGCQNLNASNLVVNNQSL